MILLRTDSVWLPISYSGSSLLTGPTVDVGKAGKHLSQGAEIGRQHKTHALREYEILIGDPRAVRWVETHGVPKPQNFGSRHVDAGVDVHGHQIFITQVSHNGGIHPARANSGASGMSDPSDPPTWCLNLVHCRCVRCLWRQRVGVPSELGVAVKYRFSIVEPANHRNTVFFVMRDTRLRVRERNED